MVLNCQNADCSLRKTFLLCHLLKFSAHFRSLLHAFKLVFCAVLLNSATMINIQQPRETSLMMQTMRFRSILYNKSHVLHTNLPERFETVYSVRNRNHDKSLISNTSDLTIDIL